MKIRRMKNKNDIPLSLEERIIEIGGDPYYVAWAHYQRFGYYNHPGSEESKITKNGVSQNGSRVKNTNVKK